MRSSFRKSKRLKQITSNNLIAIALLVLATLALERLANWAISVLTSVQVGEPRSLKPLQVGLSDLPAFLATNQARSPAGSPTAQNLDLPANIPPAIARATASVVVITHPGVDAETTAQHGSGVIVDARKGLVLTARHVILGLKHDFGDSDTLLVHTADKRDLMAKVVKVSGERSDSGTSSTDTQPTQENATQDNPLQRKPILREFPNYPMLNLMQFMPRRFQPGGFQSRGFQPGGFQPGGFQPGELQSRGTQGVPRRSMPGEMQAPQASGADRENQGESQGETSSFANDMALIQITNPAADLVAAPLASSSKLPPGTEAWTIGAPGCRFTVTADNCGPRQLRKTQIVEPPDSSLQELVVVQSGMNPKTGQQAAPGMPGASGGGLFNANGEYIGEVVMGNAQTEGEMDISQEFAGSVPIETIRAFIGI